MHMLTTGLVIIPVWFFVFCVCVCYFLYLFVWSLLGFVFTGQILGGLQSHDLYKSLALAAQYLAASALFPTLLWVVGLEVVAANWRFGALKHALLAMLAALIGALSSAAAMKIALPQIRNSNPMFDEFLVFEPIALLHSAILVLMFPVLAILCYRLADRLKFRQLFPVLDGL